MSIICVGAVLWDIFENARHLGGPSLNVACHAVRCGLAVRLVSAVGDDGNGWEALQEMKDLGLDTQYITVTSKAQTGTVDVTLSDGQPDYVINRPAAYDFPVITPAQRQQLAANSPDFIYFGTLEQLSRQTRQLLSNLWKSCPDALKFYDVNLRKDSYTPELVQELLAAADVLKINDHEMLEIGTLCQLPTGSFEQFSVAIAKQFSISTVCITRGVEGCTLWRAGEYVEAPGVQVKLADAVGAGDAFCAMLMAGLRTPQMSLCQIGERANRLGALVASRNGAVPHWSLDEL